jgi:hypothetical protein
MFKVVFFRSVDVQEQEGKYNHFEAEDYVWYSDGEVFESEFSCWLEVI